MSSMNSQKNPEAIERKRLRFSIVNSAATQTELASPLTTVPAHAIGRSYDEFMHLVQFYHFSDDPVKTATISLRIPAITVYTTQFGQFTRSDVVQCGGIRWHVFVRPMKGNGRNIVSCFLVGYARGTWSAYVDAKFRVVCTTDAGMDYETREETFLYGTEPLVNSWGHAELISREVSWRRN